MKRNISNFLIVVLNIIPLAIAFLLLEYEISKSLNPFTIWVNTPKILDIIIAVAMVLMSIFVITVIILTYVKKIEKPSLQLKNGRLINLTGLINVFTAINWLFVGIIILILKNNLDFVLLPWVRF